MGQCFSEEKPRCSNCRTITQRPGLCPRCQAIIHQAANKGPQMVKKKQQTPIFKPRQPILFYPNIKDPDPQAQGLYPPKTVYRNGNEQISQKVPINRERTKFQWEKRSCWYYPSVIQQYAPNLIQTRTFQEKLLWFRLNIQSLRITWEKGAQFIKIDRAHLVKSSLKGLKNVNLRKQIKIQFDDEEVYDAGGLQRQWMNLLMQQIFKPDQQTRYFQMCSTSDTSYKFSPGKKIKPQEMNNICYLLGVVMGKAIFDRVSINCPVNRTILRQIACQPIFLADFYSYDSKLYDSYHGFLVGNNIEEVGLNFCLYINDFDNNLQEVPLVQNGQNILVTEQNKASFVSKAIDYYCTKSVESYIKKVKQGVFRVIPQHLLSVFQPHEMEMLISGPTSIDVEDWRLNTDYKGYNANSQQVKWFWKRVKTYSPEQLTNLLHYCTGTTRVPILGFKYLQSNRNQIARFAIYRIELDPGNPYPKSHTCFNRLQLPQYKNYEQLKQNLDVIANNRINHYGFD